MVLPNTKNAKLYVQPGCVLKIGEIERMIDTYAIKVLEISAPLSGSFTSANNTIHTLILKNFKLNSQLNLSNLRNLTHKIELSNVSGSGSIVLGGVFTNDMKLDKIAVKVQIHGCKIADLFLKSVNYQFIEADLQTEILSCDAIDCAGAVGVFLQNAMK